MKDFNLETHCYCQTCGNVHKKKAITTAGRSYLQERIFTETQKFWLQVSFTADPEKCWIWQGSSANGKAVFTYRTKHTAAARWSYTEHSKTQLESKQKIFQTCDNKLCVNPLHLKLGIHDLASAEDFTKRNQAIVRWYLENNTLENTGQKFKMTRERVRQILNENGIKPRSSTPKTHIKKLKPKLTSKERFWLKVDKKGEDDCWLWKDTDPTEYGRFRFKGKGRYAHQVAYWLANKKQAKSWTLHRCDTPACCNPKHLYDGTAADNAQDREKRHPREGYRKFSEEQIKNIKDRLSKGESRREIAKTEKTTYTTIGNIDTGKTYKNGGDVRSSNLQTKCLRVLVGQDAYAAQIAKAIGVKHHSSVYLVLHRFVKNGYATIEKSKNFSITEKGRAVLDALEIIEK